ncbi:MAG: hypothetical protein JSV65_04185 [Armatimonadota bacterium]|nr:MAG: hypothetical protein JSV65_04185 [Armatimonadota bacterium]
MDAVGKRPPAAIYPAVFLTSASVLMLQVALTRLFSFTLWYHFAYVVISLALLGYGAAGALLSAFPGILRGNLPRTLFWCALAFAAFIPASLAIYAHTPFYPLQLLRQPVQWWYLGAYYAAAGIPFFLGGVCIAGAISAASERVTRVYCADLVGAGLGAGVVVPAIWRLETPGVVMLAAGVMAGAALCWGWWWRPQTAIAPVALIVLLAGGGGAFWRSLEFRPSSEKWMAVQLASGYAALAAEEPRSEWPAAVAEQIPVYRHLRQHTRWGAVFRVDVLERMEEDSGLGVTKQPGVTVRLRGPRPHLLSVPHDGDANTAIYRAADASELGEFFADHVLTLPYAILPPRPEVLIIGAGGGREMLVALRSGARRTTAVELDPITARLLTQSFRDYAGALSERPGVRYVVGEGRSFVRQSRQQYDLIEINGTDTLTAANLGANVLFENYLYTVEAAQNYLAHLREGGVLCYGHLDAFGAPGQTPFRQSILRAGAALEAVRRSGAKRPADHIAVIFGRGIMLHLVRADPFPARAVSLLERRCAENGFVPVHLPYRSLANELSWFLRTSPPARGHYMRRSPLRRDPPTDDSPFIWPYYKWGRVLHPAHRYERAAMASGQLVLVPLLGVAVLSALAFILAPLALFRRRGVYSPSAGGLAVYFAALGFGFMFIEISFIQKFVLFLGYPTYSLTVVLSSLLVSSGVGSLVSQRAISRAERSLVWVLVGLLALGVLYLGFGATIFQAFLGYALWARIAVAVLLIAPLGFAMGMFFPTGIRVVNEIAPSFVPWAWGINASTSVVAAILAVMLAMSAGFRMVGIAALGIYVIGVVGLYASRRRARRVA